MPTVPMKNTDSPPVASRRRGVLTGGELRGGRNTPSPFASGSRFLTALLSLLAGSAVQATDPPKSIPGASGAADIHILDGRTFRGPGGAIGKLAQREDVFLFRGGEFLSRNCQEYGFTAGPYWVREAGGVIHFRAELKSPEHGVMVYEGRVRGDQLEANFTWTKKRWYWTIERDFWFEGRRVRGE
jgi:hypothetical protein